MTVYADELFFINFIACYALLYFFSSAAEMKRSKPRIFLSAVFGGIIAAIRFCAGNMLMYLSVAAELLIPIIAFRYISLRQICLFILIKYVISGFLILLISFSKSTNAYIRNGMLYLNVNYIIFAIIWLGMYVLSVITFRILKKRRRIYTLHIHTRKKLFIIKALYDSGNSLINPYNGKGVIITDLAELHPVDSYMLIPFKGLNTHGMLTSFIADEILIEEKNIRLKNTAIAISETKLSKAGRYNALIGPAIFKE